MIMLLLLIQLRVSSVYTLFHKALGPNNPNQIKELDEHHYIMRHDDGNDTQELSQAPF